MLLKKINTQYIAVIIALLIVTLCCAILVIPGKSRSGDELFQVLVLDPMPASAIVLHSQDNETGFDGRLWLHFKISPDDFNLILASKKWQIDPDSTDFMGSDQKVAGWWKPQSLGENVVEYSLLLKSDGNRKRVEYMWANSQRIEGYLFYLDEFTR